MIRYDHTLVDLTSNFFVLLQTWKFIYMIIHSAWSLVWIFMKERVKDRNSDSQWKTQPISCNRVMKICKWLKEVLYYLHTVPWLCILLLLFGFFHYHLHSGCLNNSTTNTITSDILQHKQTSHYMIVPCPVIKFNIFINLLKISSDHISYLLKLIINLIYIRSIFTYKKIHVEQIQLALCVDRIVWQIFFKKYYCLSEISFWLPCKQCRSRSASFWRSWLFRIFTVFKQFRNWFMWERLVLTC